jgi:hypothetical protein
MLSQLIARARRSGLATGLSAPSLAGELSPGIRTGDAKIVLTGIDLGDSDSSGAEQLLESEPMLAQLTDEGMRARLATASQNRY